MPINKMSERKFTRGLNKPGMAAQLRENVSQVVRESTVQNKPHLVEPIDFENFILKNKTLIQNDPQRELLLYPPDDVSHVSLPLRPRTIVTGAPVVNPVECEGPACSLLTRQALQTYTTSNHIVHYKYRNYSGTCHDLPKLPKSESPREELYEIDTDADQIDDNMSRSQTDGISKQGYLLKGPDTTSDRMFAHIGSKSFKRRYCYLRQEVDGTYILELHKDEKKGDAKATIVMDFCTDVVRNLKRGRFCFELRMTEGHKSYTLAADSESEMQDWISKLTSVIQQNKLQEEKRAASLERAVTSAPPSPAPVAPFGTLKGLDQSMNPQLMKYGRETDVSIAIARRDNRRKLFSGYTNVTKTTLIDNVDPYREQFGQRMLLECESLKFRLQAPIEGERENLCQVEPYFTSICLFDVRANRKLTENFYFDINHELAKDMLTDGDINLRLNNNKRNGTTESKTTNGSTTNELETGDIKFIEKEWIKSPKRAILSVTNPHSDIFLVVRIDKVLQGSICNTSEPYLKATKDPRLGLKVHKSAKAYCQKLGHYRMPFAWAARPLFRLYSNELDVNAEFPAILRQEGQRLKDEDILKLLQDYRKPDKFSKLTVIPGWLRVSIQSIQELPENCLTTSLLPLRPFQNQSGTEPTFEITEFQSSSDRDVHPYTVYLNHLFIYPQNLIFDTQKIFNRARNIACIVEIRDSDAEDAKPLYCIYGRPETSILINQINCAVLHHNTTPSFYEEIKIRLPICLTALHHILFTFIHVSCELSKKRDNGTESCVGYAWIPLLNKGKINVEPQVIPVATHLPPGYLAIQPLGLGKGNAGPEITWIDGQKPLFSVSFYLDSTVLTQDTHLHNLFQHAERLLDNKHSAMPSESETCKILKAAHAMSTVTAITFLPTILNQLFTLLIVTSSEEIGLNIVRLLVHIIHMVHEAGRNELLLSYVKYVFKSPVKEVSSPRTVGPNGNTTHGELCKHLPTLLHPNNTDFLLVNKFMLHSGLFFDIIIKSMAQHLLSTGRIRMLRNERFPAEFPEKLQCLISILVPYLINRYKDMPVETHQLNKSLAQFLKRCLTFMDRGLIFKLIRSYMERFSPAAPRTLQEFKLSFLQEICSHEHYIIFNLPFQLSPKGLKPDVMHQYCLSDEFCKQHFLVALLLQEVKASLNEITHIRRIALSILRDLLAKHELDDRYQNKGQMNRIAMLYIPWLGIVLENLNRINDSDCKTDVDKSLNRLSTNSVVFNSVASTASTTTPKNFKRFTLHVEPQSPLRASMHLKDSTYFAAIAGQGMVNGTSSASISSDNSNYSDGRSTVSQDTTIIRGEAGDVCYRRHNRSISVTQPPLTPRCDKLQYQEVGDMLQCFLFIVKHLAEDKLIAWWRHCSESEIVNFFAVLEMCIQHFKYIGKKNIPAEPSKDQDGVTRRNAKAQTLPARINPPTNGDYTLETGTLTHNRENLANKEHESTRLHQALLAANLSTEIGMVCLDSMGLYCVHFRETLIGGPVMERIASVYLRFLEIGQSETLSRHVFAALRAFINNFSHAIFKGNASICGRLCYELLRCCDSRLSTIRQESCAVLYLLMRSNFEFSSRKGFTRVHLQVIISVSQMLGNVIGLNNARFQESLSLINSYANSDKAMKGSGFPLEVKDLTKRVRTVLMATAQMRAHHTDPERLLGLQHSLANSYAATPELRHTWLQAMARNHLKDGNYSEAACCQLHIAALMAEYLKLRNNNESGQKWGAEALSKISKNIAFDEKGLKLDSGAHETQYTEHLLLEQLETCADYIEKSERYELLGELYRLIIPMYEKKRSFEHLAHCYQELASAYNKIVDVTRSGKRLLGRFYRVAFFGHVYFEEDSAIEYIYKEPKVTTLSEISERLHKQYGDKFGMDVVKMIMDSAPVTVSELDPKFAYIQVTHVTPYFEKTEFDERQTEFEQNHDVSTFMYETPFTKAGKPRGNPQDQWKRRTILTTQYAFPYITKRITVVDRRSIELGPIEVALDEMQSRVGELEDVVFSTPTDAKKLQLRLQGSVCVQVNAGPLAYASVFLDPVLSSQYPEEKVEELKDIFREFIKICYTALQTNGRLISSDQYEYQNALRENFQKLCNQLSVIFNEALWPHDDDGSFKRNSLALFSAISGASHQSSIA